MTFRGGRVIFREILGWSIGDRESSEWQPRIWVEEETSRYDYHDFLVYFHLTVVLLFYSL